MHVSSTRVPLRLSFLTDAFIISVGHGHTVQYLDREKVTKYIALEPNVLMHPHIRAAAASAGFLESDGTCLILSCGAEDTQAILSSLNASNEDQTQKVDTIISILTMCSVPSPSSTIQGLVRSVLCPGGQFLFYEHVLSPREDVAWWQRFWAPIWSRTFDGCRLDRPTHLYLKSVQIASEGVEGSLESAWAEEEMWGKPGEIEENLFWHQAGRLVRK